MRDEMHAEPMMETTAVRDAILRGARLATSEPSGVTRTAGDAALDHRILALYRQMAARRMLHLPSAG